MKSVVLIAVISVLIGCASALERHERVQMSLDRPVNCGTAQADIQMLEKEKVSTTEQVANGVAAVLPTAAVYNLFTGEYGSRYKIASGEYNDMLVKKIEQIKKQCG